MVARSKATPEQLTKHRFNKRSNSTRRIASLKVLEFRHAALKLKMENLQPSYLSAELWIKCQPLHARQVSVGSASENLMLFLEQQHEALLLLPILCCSGSGGC